MGVAPLVEEWITIRDPPAPLSVGVLEDEGGTVRYTYSGLAVRLGDRKFDRRVQSHLDVYADAGWRLVSTGQRDEADTVEFSFFWEAGD